MCDKTLPTDEQAKTWLAESRAKYADPVDASTIDIKSINAAGLASLTTVNLTRYPVLSEMARTV